MDYVDQINDNLNSEIDEYINCFDENIFWYRILYTIGSYVMSVSSLNIQLHNKIKLLKTPKSGTPPATRRIRKISTINLKFSDGSDFENVSDFISKIFCGYWILYTIE